MPLTRPFIRLPLRFDAARLAAEARALDASAWMPHPSGLPGNTAVALVSRDGEDNNDFGGAMAPTAHLARCPYHRQVMASLGEVIARSRLMRLAPGAEVPPHVDFNYHWRSHVRLHVPVLTTPEVRFHCGDAVVHMRAGECWLFDSWRRHRVVNASAQARIHLVIDLAGSSRFWRRVREVEALDPLADRARIDAIAAALEWDPAVDAEVPTERFNQAPVMAPGELEALVAEIVADFERCEANDPALVERYRELLGDLALDWRSLWHRHGMRAEGFPEYRALLERTRRDLHPSRRALVMASNGVGVNPVIVQRVLRAALAEHELARFAAAAGTGHAR